MNTLENKIRNILIELKEKYNLTGIKAEFEAEGASFEEIFMLKNYTEFLGIDLSVKIGGCEAMRDLYDLKRIGVNCIIAPMIESVQEIKKFTNSILTVFQKDYSQNLKLYINIESINGIKNLNEIINSKEFSYINGIVFGRNDMAKSLDLDISEVDSNEILEYASTLSNISIKNDKEFIIGGNFTSNSIPFIKNFDNSSLTKFETRKIIFENKGLLEKDMLIGLNLAIQFEYLWLDYIQKHYNYIIEKNIIRQKQLQERYSKIL